MLRGDLDWITDRALESERERRYESASSLTADVRRYLDNMPVLAAPPSVAYRMSKFVRRHRVGVVAGAAVAVMLVVLAVTMTVHAIRLARERDYANREAALAKRTTADAARLLGNKITVRGAADARSGRAAGAI